jgi:hypothetical protein
MFRVWNKLSPLFLAATEMVRDTHMNTLTQYTFVDPDIPKDYLFNLDPAL